MKWFLRLFVALCLFLAGGYNVLHSQPHRYAANSPQVTLPAKAHLTSLTATQDINASDVGNAVSFKAKIRGVIDDSNDDDDDDEKSSHGKLVNSSRYLPALSYTSHSNHCANHPAKRAPFRDHYLYTSSSRYLLFSVFRI
jgi:hypothetical protein